MLMKYFKVFDSAQTDTVCKEFQFKTCHTERSRSVL